MVGSKVPVGAGNFMKYDIVIMTSPVGMKPQLMLSPHFDC